MLDPVKEKELLADIAGLEIGDLTLQAYEKLMVLQAVKFFHDLEAMGGLKRFLDMAQRSDAPAEHPASAATSQASQARTVETYGNSEFLLAVSGKDSAEAWDVMDELMETMRTARRSVYDDVLRKILRL